MKAFIGPDIIIPAYQPTTVLVDLVRQLSAQVDSLYSSIVVVNDGSGPSCAAIFSELARLPGVTVLEHAINLGKGQALKTGFNFVLLNHPGIVGIVTADADGQHTVPDIEAVARRLAAEPKSLVLGARHFQGEVPFRSRFGNILTRKVFQFLVGTGVTDTQTGLRGLPWDFLGSLLRLKSTGYEFELDMLMLAVTGQQRKIVEVPIRTIYEPGNPTSHFNPLLDSVRIYFVFLRFIFSSVLTFVLDSVVFALVYWASGMIFASTCAARLVAGTFNFTLGRSLVFRSSGQVGRELWRYASLVAILMLISYGSVLILVDVFGMRVLPAKILSESILFLLSFAAQRVLVFQRAPVDGESLMAPEKTDWDSYYEKPAAPARFTRKITTRKLLRCLRMYNGDLNHATIVEWGGANSCFYKAIRDNLRPRRYQIFDSNQTGLRKFRENWPDAEEVILNENDILRLPTFAAGQRGDVCFSVGLIEHFEPRETGQAIAAHFASVRPGGLVAISFPTPTWLYRVTRWLAEKARVWVFPDERPLTMKEVLNEVTKHGTVSHTEINWPIFLTQGMVVAMSREMITPHDRLATFSADSGNRVSL